MAKLMVQGTTSSAGKSLLVTGLMRLYHKRGYRCFPFKSQNMSSKFSRTPNGDMISKAQELQAIAGGLVPEARMNPLLLVPQTDMGSLVVRMGKEVGHMEAREYFAYKKGLAPFLLEVFQGIERDYPLVFIEGAGSPAEINLREHDIVNMGLAELVDAPVILIADIDRGGVFASIYGTVMLLRPEERARIRGIVINKFRGDPSLLQSGIETIESLTQIPVLGLLPYRHFELTDEDSLVTEHKRVNEHGQTTEEMEEELDKLASMLEENLDIEAIDRILGLC